MNCEQPALRLKWFCQSSYQTRVQGPVLPPPFCFDYLWLETGFSMTLVLEFRFFHNGKQKCWLEDLLSWPSLSYGSLHFHRFYSTYWDSTLTTKLYQTTEYFEVHFYEVLFITLLLLLSLCVIYTCAREWVSGYPVAVRGSLAISKGICPLSSVASRGRLGSSGLHGKCFYPLSCLACHVAVDFQILSSSQKEPCFTYHGVCPLMRQNVHIPNYSVVLFTIFLSVKHISGSLFFLVKVTFIYYF